jgi:signal transduction histidine kinase
VTTSRLPEDLERLLHDLRGPLNALSMHAEVLKRAVLADDAAGASVRTIQQETERLAGMLAAALGIVSLERTESRRVSLRSVVEAAQDETGAKELVIVDGAWPHVVGDERLLVIAVGHLVRNAVEATEAKGSGTPPPEVSVEPDRGGAVRLAVRDYGPGLRSTSPKVLIRLRTTAKAGHQGIGLMVVERVARLHGGGLTFDAAAPGARVTLRLPSADAG